MSSRLNRQGLNCGVCPQLVYLGAIFLLGRAYAPVGPLSLPRGDVEGCLIKSVEYTVALLVRGKTVQDP